MTRWHFALAVAAGGALGAVARWLVSEWIVQDLGRSVFLATFSVNVLGSLLLGFVIGAVDAHVVSPGLRGLLAVGGLGAFTTYSTYAVDALRLLDGGHYGGALAYVAGTAFICMIAAWTGLSAARALF